MRNSNLIFVVLLTGISITLSQPNIEWSKKYGGQYVDTGNYVEEKEGGGYLVTGYTQSIHGRTEIWVFGTDINGDSTFSKTYNLSNDGAEMGKVIHQRKDKGFTFLAYAAPNYDGNIYLYNYNFKGIKQWSKIYGGNRNESLGSFKQTSDGGYIIAGGTDSFGKDYWTNFYLLKINSNGDTTWTKTYGMGGREYANDVHQTLDGGYIIFGIRHYFGSWIIRTNSLGDTLWTKTFDDLRINSGLQNADGSFAMTGYVFGNVEGDLVTAVLVKISDVGEIIWRKEFADSKNKFCTFVAKTSDGGYVITGRKQFDAYYDDLNIIKTNKDGDMVWEKTIIGNIGSGYGNCIQQTKDDGYIIVGITDRIHSGNGNLWLIKLETDVTLLNLEKENWQKRIRILQNYPNPFNPTTIIEYTILNDSKVNVIIYDLMGNEIKTLINDYKRVGQYKVNWDGKDDSGQSVSGGIYFYKLFVDGFTQTRKMVLLK